MSMLAPTCAEIDSVARDGQTSTKTVAPFPCDPMNSALHAA